MHCFVWILLQGLDLGHLGQFHLLPRFTLSSLLLHLLWFLPQPGDLLTELGRWDILLNLLQLRYVLLWLQCFEYLIWSTLEADPIILSVVGVFKFLVPWILPVWYNCPCHYLGLVALVVKVQWVLDPIHSPNLLGVLVLLMWTFRWIRLNSQVSLAVEFTFSPAALEFLNIICEGIQLVCLIPWFIWCLPNSRISLSVCLVSFEQDLWNTFQLLTTWWWLTLSWSVFRFKTG